MAPRAASVNGGDTSGGFPAARPPVLARREYRTEVAAISSRGEECSAARQAAPRAGWAAAPACNQGTHPMSVKMPAPDSSVLDRRDRIVKALRAIVPGEGVIATVSEMRPYESDGLTA